MPSCVHHHLLHLEQPGRRLTGSMESVERFGLKVELINGPSMNEILYLMMAIVGSVVLLLDLPGVVEGRFWLRAVVQVEEDVLSRVSEVCVGRIGELTLWSWRSSAVS